MLRIRLRRTGAKKKPSYRLVVADARAPRDGRFVDIVGHYNPRTEPTTIVIDAAKAQRWLAQGAQPSDRVARLFQRQGITARAGAPPVEAAAATVEPAAVPPVQAAPIAASTEPAAVTALAPETGTPSEAEALGTTAVDEGTGRAPAPRVGEPGTA